MGHALRTTTRQEAMGTTGANVVRVVAVEDQQLVVAPPGGPAATYAVRRALPPGAIPRPGDEALVVESEQGPVAIALLSPQASLPPLTDGTSVQLAPDGTSVEVVRADGTSLFRYDAVAGRGRVTLANESLDFEAAAGDLRLRAAGEVRLEGRSVHAVGRQPGAEASLRLSPREARVEARTVRLEGRDLDLNGERTSLRSEEVQGVIGRAVIEARRLESVADVVVQTARTFYQRVQELAQQRAGTLRTIVDDTISVKAKELIVSAVEAYKLRSEKIHLG